MHEQHDSTAEKTRHQRSASGPQDALAGLLDEAHAVERLPLGPDAVSPAGISALQRIVGNAAVSRLLRPLEQQGTSALPAPDTLTEGSPAAFPIQSVFRIQQTSDQAASAADRAALAPQGGQPRHLMATQKNAALKSGAIPIQRFRQMAPLREVGWKFSGGSMATHSNLDQLWHATVFKVDKNGKSSDVGQFFDGFHLTMNHYPAPGKSIEPHVFFKANGNYDEAATLGHGKTKAYRGDVGPVQWDYDLLTAKALATRVLANLAALPELTEARRQEIEEAWKAEKDRVKEEGEVLAAAQAEQESRRLADVAAAVDEKTSVEEFLKDVDYKGPSYYEQFTKYINNEEVVIKDAGLKKAADWYLQGRAAHWMVRELPQNAYKNWGKTPAAVTWTQYPNSLSVSWRAKDPSTGFISEFRELRFKGYASYKQHPRAKKAPKG